MKTLIASLLALLFVGSVQSQQITQQMAEDKLSVATYAYNTVLRNECTTIAAYQTAADLFDFAKTQYAAKKNLISVNDQVYIEGKLQLIPLELNTYTTNMLFEGGVSYTSGIHCDAAVEADSQQLWDTTYNESVAALNDALAANSYMKMAMTGVQCATSDINAVQAVIDSYK